MPSEVERSCRSLSIPGSSSHVSGSTVPQSWKFWQSCQQWTTSVPTSSLTRSWWRLTIGHWSFSTLRTTAMADWLDGPCASNLTASKSVTDWEPATLTPMPYLVWWMWMILLRTACGLSRRGEMLGGHPPNLHRTE